MIMKNYYAKITNDIPKHYQVSMLKRLIEFIESGEESSAIADFKEKTCYRLTKTEKATQIKITGNC